MGLPEVLYYRTVFVSNILPGRKKETVKKNKLLLDIDKIRLQLSNTVPTSGDNSLLIQLEKLEDKLKKIYDFETNGLITRSRVRWVQEGEKSTKYFCNLENMGWHKKNIFLG